MHSRPNRADVPAELTWNLNDIFPSYAAWEQELAAVEAAIPTVTQYRGRLQEGPGVLLACLTAQEKLYERFNRVYNYGTLRLAEEGSSPANQAGAARLFDVEARLEAAMAFVRSEILDLPEGTVEGYIAREPGLHELKSHLEEILRTRPHRLHPHTEAALAALGEVTGLPYTVYERAKASDMEFAPIAGPDGSVLPMSFALYEDRYEPSPDVALRRAAYASFVAGLKRYENTFAATWAAEVKKHVVMARLRNYPSATEMLLQPQKVTVALRDNLLDVIQSELAPHMQRLARLRKRLLGLDKLLYCDIQAPMDPEFRPQVTYEEASELILDSLEMMGSEYTKIIRTGLKERWVDLADNVGKSTGAFCATPYGVHSFILITWTDTMRGAFVLTHELGHAGHFYLTHRYQRYFNTDPSLYFVEAPSTCNELLLGQHILAKTTEPRMRRWVIMQFLGTYHHNFVTHLLEGELQRRAYALAEQGEPITAETLSALKGEILQGFWGDTVEIDEGARLTWMRQPHYYMGLYPYTYSAGLTAATAVAQMIREEGQPAVDRWLQVLKAGSTMAPLDLMKLAGVDMSSPEPIRKAVAFVGSLVDELESSFA